MLKRPIGILFFMTTLLVCPRVDAVTSDKASYAALTFIMLTSAANGIAAIYSHKARKTLQDKHQSELDKVPVDRSLQASTWMFTISSLLIGFSMAGLIGEDGMGVVVGAELGATLLSLGGLIATSIAYGIEANTQYIDPVTNTRPIQV